MVMTMTTTKTITTSNVDAKANVADKNEDNGRKDRDIHEPIPHDGHSMRTQDGWFLLQRDFITNEVSGLIPISSCFKQHGDKRRKMLTKVAFENNPVLEKPVKHSLEDRMVLGSNPRSETLKDPIVLGSNPFRPNNLLLDYFNYYYELWL